jgi:hypothetical protein
MKKLFTIVQSVALLGLMTVGTWAHDQDLKEHVTFHNPVVVNKTWVEPGDYLIRYDAATRQMMIFDGNELVAAAPATVQYNADEFEHDAVLYTRTVIGNVLTGVYLGGQHEALHLQPEIESVSISGVIW